ncbi:MAG TPA: hypothetical protein VK187_03940 [Geobacteraceae bacterium]|nr:hypothetical protein [Geobacteraceae bacterium]
MPEERIEVTAYAGYRGDETPRCMVLDGKRIDVVRVLERWVEEDGATGKRRRCFRVKGNDFRTHTLCHDEEGMEWCYLR